MVYDWKLLLLLFKSGIETNPGPNESIDSNLIKKADEIVERGRQKNKGGARRNAGRGGRSGSFGRDLSGNEEQKRIKNRTLGLHCGHLLFFGSLCCQKKLCFLSK